MNESKTEKEKSNKLSCMISKLFSVLEINRESTLTAEQANIIARYGTRATSFESVVKDEIKKIQASIYDKLSFSSSEKMLNILVPKDKKELYERVKDYFSEAGYKTFYIDRSKVEELGENKYLFISWDLSEEELANKLIEDRKN